jgi:SAM-dependent methyltransferase
VGSEISAEAARSAAQVAPVVVADGARLPFVSGSLGSVTCTEVLEHVDDPSEVLAEMARVLRRGGLAYVTTPNYANLAGLHKWLADRWSRGHDWNPWGAHKGGFEAFMTGRRLARAAQPHLEIQRVRGLDYGQAMTGRFRPLDRLAWSWVGRVGLPPLLRRLDRPTRGPWRWHGMHVELFLRRRPGEADHVAADGSAGKRVAGALSHLLPRTVADRLEVSRGQRAGA